MKYHKNYNHFPESYKKNSKLSKTGFSFRKAL